MPVDPDGPSADCCAGCAVQAAPRAYVTDAPDPHLGAVKSRWVMVVVCKRVLHRGCRACRDSGMVLVAPYRVAAVVRAAVDAG